MTPIQGVSCEVCGMQRAPGAIHARPSKLIKNQKIMICNRCEVAGNEPRSFIILTILSKGLTDEIKEYIKGRRYVGKDILLEDIV